MGAWLYVIADDEVSLGIFPREGNGRGRLMAALPGPMPRDQAERKEAKPDLEALAHLPPHGKAEHGALLALGSGSSPQRRRAVWWALDGDGALAGEPSVVALEELYAALAGELDGLNIEGATVRGDDLVLAQRGEGPDGTNALVRLDLEGVLAALAGGSGMDGGLVRDVRVHDLGTVDDVKLAFSDLSALPDGRIVFSAVAEDSPDGHTDGEFVGATIGLLAADGERLETHTLSPAAKVEGVRARPRAGGIDLVLVADGDDRAVPAPVYRSRLEEG